MHFVNTERINKVVIYFKSSSICVSPGFGGLTGDLPAVRPAGARWSDRREHGGQTGGGDRRRQAISVVRPINLQLSDRRVPGGQTGVATSVRPRSVEFEGNFYFR